jgi:hypothetical protein
VSLPLLIQGQNELLTILNNGSQAGAFGSITFAAVRRYLPLYTKEDLANLTVSILASDNASTFIDRQKIEENPIIHIGVQKALAKPEDLSECDGLMTFVGQIADFIATDANRVLPCKLALMKVVNSPPYDPTHFEKQVFTSVLACHYEKTRIFR